MRTSDLIRAIKLLQEKTHLDVCFTDITFKAPYTVSFHVPAHQNNPAYDYVIYPYGIIEKQYEKDGIKYKERID